MLNQIIARKGGEPDNKIEILVITNFVNSFKLVFDFFIT